MLFNTLTYLIFLPLVFLMYWSMRGVRGQNWVVVVASMVFYGWWSPPCLALMVGTCVANYLLVGGMVRPAARRKAWLVAALVLNFGILGVFKYFNFFAQNLAALLLLFGLKPDMPTLDIILPVGISFYTFQLSAYVIDCYRGTLEPTRSLLRFMAFICFFPQLVAGPIERGHKLLPQFAARRRFDGAEATDGMRLLLWGLVKKMLIADNCATQVDYIFANYQDVSTPTLWLGALYFTFQIYGDFSGYSDMAVGSAKLLGIRISANFDKPYFATSLPEFWRRWHITLMGWFRDYVYIPLGGNRRGPARQTANRFAVFLLSGLWHGSNWTFVLWGLYHALCYRLPARRLTFLVVLLGWVIFRAEDATMAAGYLSGMFCPRMLSSVACSRMPLLPIALLVVAEWLMRSAPHPFQWRNTGWQSHQWVRLAVYLLVFSVTVLAGGATVQFIYFQF